MGAPVMVEIENETDPLEIARKELKYSFVTFPAMVSILVAERDAFQLSSVDICPTTAMRTGHSTSSSLPIASHGFILLLSLALCTCQISFLCTLEQRRQLPSQGVTGNRVGKGKSLKLLFLFTRLSLALLGVLYCLIDERQELEQFVGIAFASVAH